MEILGKPNVSDFFSELARFDLQGLERKIKVVLIDVDRIFDSVIDAMVKIGTRDGDEALKNKGKKDFRQILLELKEKEDGAEPMTMTYIKALLMVFFSHKIFMIL
ncbi:Licodione synthase [Camellia lanceoleosa]|uniref:Licodione synthase n=1 Tax=Camellia lanceoleosa TaxID=1840588 RepID=A0ACC0G4H7_9ERIC|nr:Licodione synthase [Camellia lanceoleosa]